MSAVPHNDPPKDEQAKTVPGADPAVARAEEIVDRVGERLGYVAVLAGQRIRKATARAREEAEDIWAEAQHLRRTGQG